MKLSFSTRRLFLPSLILILFFILIGIVSGLAAANWVDQSRAGEVISTVDVNSFAPDICKNMGLTDIVVQRNGTQGNDLLIGGPGDDKFNGLGGNDCIIGGGGNDNIDGGGGNDIIIGGPGDDNLNGGQGDDYLDGGPGTDTCNIKHGTDTTNDCEIIIN
jgi:Ca2+-binding RTX toxin-like protein